MAKNIIKIKLFINKDGERELSFEANKASHKDMFAIVNAINYHLIDEIDKFEEKLKDLQAMADK